MKRFCLYVLTIIIISASASPTVAKSYKLREGIDNIAEQLIAGIPKDKKLIIAVVDFTDLQGNTNDLGRYVSDRLNTRLTQHPDQLKIVARQRLAEVLKELKISMSGLVDETTAKKAGMLLGADSLVLGTIVDMGEGIDVSAKIVEVETGKFLPGAMASLKKDAEVQSLLGLVQTADTSKPAKPAEIKAQVKKIGPITCETEEKWLEQGLTKYCLFARGMARGDASIESKYQRMSTSRNAAKVNSQYTMVDIIRGFHMKNGVTVEKTLEHDSEFASKIHSVISAAKIVRTEWTTDDGCIVVTRIPTATLEAVGVKLPEYVPVE